MDDENETTQAEMSIEARAAARVTGPGPYEVPLEFPIKAKIKIEGGGTREETYELVSIRRPGMKEITDSSALAEKKGNSAGLYWLAATLTGLPEHVIHLMDPDDFAEVEAIIEVFMQKFQRGGRRNSAI